MDVRHAGFAVAIVALCCLGWVICTHTDDIVGYDKKAKAEYSYQIELNRQWIDLAEKQRKTDLFIAIINSK